MENATKVIDKTVVGKTMPTNPNTLWLDTTEGEKNAVLKYKGNPIAGGGAGSSNPTEADATKVWQVTHVQKGTKTEEVVIAPQQIMNINIGDQNSAILQNTNNLDKFVNGAKVIAVIDGTEYEGTVEQEDFLAVLLQKEPRIAITKVPAEESPTGEDILALIYQGEHVVSVNVVGETSTYDYNWAPGVKIPIPTAEDEGKILVVTKVAGDNTSIIVPEQSVSNNEYFQNSDISKFVVGNEVKYTISEGVSSFTKTGSIINDDRGIVVILYNPSNNEFGYIVLENTEDGKTLKFHKNGLSIGKPTIKLEYIESNYEYQLQENSGGGSSDVLWPAMYEYNDNEIMATFVPEDVEPGTWCMVCGKISGASIDTCLPVLIPSYGSYTICNKTDNSLIVIEDSVDGGKLLRLSLGGR